MTKKGNDNYTDKATWDEYIHKGYKLAKDRHAKERQYDKTHGTSYSKERVRHQALKYNYKLSTKDYADMLAKQEGVS